MIDSFTLSPEAADILSEDLKVDLRQFPFDFGYCGATLDERARIREQVWAGLRQRALADRGREEPEVEQALKLLHRSDIAVSVTYFEAATDTMFRGRIAASGRDAVRAIQEENGLRIEFVDPRGLARVCVGVLPDVPAGRLESATVSAAVEPPSTDGSDDDSWLGEVRSASRASSGVRNAEKILALPVFRIGYFFVTGMRDGARVRLPAIGWRDTEGGRYSMTTRKNQDGEVWTTFAGADQQRMAGYLAEQFRQFPG